MKDNNRPRFGSDWDLDLGWVLIWWGFFLTVASIFVSLAYASVQNNRGNIARDNYYAEHCKVLERTDSRDLTGVKYNCTEK
jgi:hypothetical protein